MKNSNVPEPTTGDLPPATELRHRLRSDGTPRRGVGPIARPLPPSWAQAFSEEKPHRRSKACLSERSEEPAFLSGRPPWVALTEAPQPPQAATEFSPARKCRERATARANHVSDGTLRRARKSDGTPLAVSLAPGSLRAKAPPSLSQACHSERSEEPAFLSGRPPQAATELSLLGMSPQGTTGSHRESPISIGLHTITCFGSPLPNAFRSKFPNFSRISNPCERTSKSSSCGKKHRMCNCSTRKSRSSPAPHAG